MTELMREITSYNDLSEAFRWASELVRLSLPGRVALFVGPPRRTREQNDKIWPMLRDIAKQVPWNGVLLSDYDWKDLVTAALKRQKLVPGLDGGLVVLGGHTSRMSVEEVSEMVEFMYAWGTEHGVIWSDPAEKVITEEHAKKLAKAAT